MLISAAPESGAGGAAAWSLMQISRFGTHYQHLRKELQELCDHTDHNISRFNLSLFKSRCPKIFCKRINTFFSVSEPWLLSVGIVEVQCNPRGEDGVESLAVIRGLLTCSEPHILLSPPVDGKQVSQIQAFKPVSSLLYFL